MKVSPPEYPDLDALLSACDISREQFERSELDWKVLSQIRDNHIACTPELQNTAGLVSGMLQMVPSVHSLKVRVKDPEHLVKKIIRKKLDHLSLPEPRGSYSDCTPENYPAQITDLVGVRAMHLFKDEWRHIHTFINDKWELHERPTAYFREGDDTGQFQIAGCEAKKHKFGYRSVHYLVKLAPSRQTHIVEVQVRTIFEEGWSEIDHTIRYPDQSQDPVLEGFLFIFNRVAGFADEMGSYAKTLHSNLREQAEKAAAALRDQAERAAAALREQEEKAAAAETTVKKLVSELKVGKQQREALQKSIDEMKSATAAPNPADRWNSILRGLQSTPAFSPSTSKANWLRVLEQLEGALKPVGGRSSANWVYHLAGPPLTDPMQGLLKQYLHGRSVPALPASAPPPPFAPPIQPRPQLGLFPGSATTPPKDARGEVLVQSPNPTTPETATATAQPDLANPQSADTPPESAIEPPNGMATASVPEVGPPSTQPTGTPSVPKRPRIHRPRNRKQKRPS